LIFELFELVRVDGGRVVWGGSLLGLNWCREELGEALPLVCVVFEDRREAFEGNKVAGLRLENEEEVVDKDLTEGFWDLAVDKLSGADFGFEVEKDCSGVFVERI
jgi:hypothetical protein